MPQDYIESRFFEEFRAPYTINDTYYPLGTFINDDVNQLNSNVFVQLYPTSRSVKMFNVIYGQSKEEYYARFQKNSSLYNVNVQLLKEYIGTNKILNIGAEFVENVGYTNAPSRIIFVEFETADHTLGLFYLGGLAPMESKNDEIRNDPAFSYNKPVFYESDTIRLDPYNFAEFICALDQEYFGNNIEYTSQFKDFENWSYVAGSIMNKDIREAKTPGDSELQARVETNIPVTSAFDDRNSQHPIDFCN